MNALNNKSQTESSVTSVRGRVLDLGSRKFWLEWRPLACCHGRIFRSGAYAGVVFNLTGALASHIASGVIDSGTLVYLVVMMGVSAASWALRPPSRRNFPAN
jgi:hypothetical protein